MEVFLLKKMVDQVVELPAPTVLVIMLEQEIHLLQILFKDLLVVLVVAVVVDIIEQVVVVELQQ